MTLHSDFRVSLLGGIYDGETINTDAQCDCCGLAVWNSGGVIVSPEGAVYRLERGHAGHAVARYVGDERQMSLDELLFGLDDDAA